MPTRRRKAYVLLSDGTQFGLGLGIDQQGFRITEINGPYQASAVDTFGIIMIEPFVKLVTGGTTVRRHSIESRYSECAHVILEENVFPVVHENGLD